VTYIPCSAWSRNLKTAVIAALQRHAQYRWIDQIVLLARCRIPAGASSTCSTDARRQLARYCLSNSVLEVGEVAKTLASEPPDACEP
jgi:hypothetical protein